MPAYDHIISLGRACQPRYQLRRIRGLADAGVFDWIITPDPGLRACIASGLAGFFDPAYLRRGPDGVVQDIRHDIRFLHEFPPGSPVEAGLAAHGARYAAQVRRWQALMASDRRVLFVRQHGWDADIAGTAALLSDTLATVAPALDFDLLYLTDPALHDPDHQAPRTRFHPLPQSATDRWEGDDTAWDRILTGVQLRPVAG